MQMMNKTGLFFDFDGTLWFGRYGDETLEELKRLAERGVLLFLNTGRSAGNLRKETAEIPFTALLCGGCTAIEKGRFLFRRDLTREEVSLVAEVTDRFGLDTVYEGVKRNYLQADYGKAAENGRKLGLVDAEPVRGADMLDVTERPATKISVLKRFDEQGVAQPFPEEARKILSRIFDVIDFPGYTECMIRGFGKDRMLAFAEKHYGIPHENTYAFGDSFNDLPMLRYAAHAAVIGHSPEGVKEVADFVTTEEENGIAEAVRAYGL